MATARFWRVIGVAAYGGGDLELSGLHLHDAAGRVDSSATLTCSHAPVAGVVSALQDADVATTCRFGRADVASATFGFVWDFGTPKAIVTVRPASADSKHPFVRSLILHSSQDGLVWGAGLLIEHIVYPGARTACALSVPAVSAAAILAVAGGGAAGAATFTDLAKNVLTPTVVGAAAYSEDFPRLHPTAVKLPVSSNLKWVHPSFQWATNVNYRVSFWVYLTSGARAQVYFSNFEGTGRLACVIPAGGKVYYNIANSGALPSGDNSVAVAGAWTFFEFGRSGGVHYSSLNGVVSRHFGDGWDNTQIGNGAFQLDVPAGTVYFSDLLVESGVPPRTGSFNPPVSELGVYTAVLDNFAPGLAGGPAQGVVAASAPLSAHACAAPGCADMARDVEFGGAGRIFGTVKEKNTPANTPLRRRVVLIDERSHLAIRETWSDSETGYYEFRGVREGVPYTVLSYDHLHNYRAVAADNLLAEVTL